MKKFIVLIGNYGSGKTEIAINLAVNSAGKGLNTLVVDLDKVNDYFRMSDRVDLLKENHVNLVSPTFASQGVTPSNMSAAVASAFAGDWICASSMSAATQRVQCPSAAITPILRRLSRVSLRCTTLSMCSVPCRKAPRR